VPRTWGYIFIAIAALIGAGSLLLPVPESIEIEQVEPVVKGKGRPAPPPQPPRARQKPAAKPAPPKPATKAFPMQDTTKGRQAVQPKPRG
jgi:hypothetical protein